MIPMASRRKWIWRIVFGVPLAVLVSFWIVSYTSGYSCWIGRTFSSGKSCYIGVDRGWINVGTRVPPTTVAIEHVVLSGKSILLMSGHGGQFVDGIHSNFLFGYANNIWDSIIALPLWLLSLIAAVPIIVVEWRSRRAKRRDDANRCRKCGYNLQSHVAGQKCPECGTDIPSADVG